MVPAASVVFAMGCTVITGGSAVQASALVSHPVFAPGISLSGVSCTSATTCTAVGQDGGRRAIYATESAGVWGAAIEVQLASVPDKFIEVSCTSARDCTAVGDAQGRAPAAPFYPIHATESGGTWGGVIVGTALGYLAGVSCTTAVDCTAVGVNGSGPVYETETAGTWGAATEVPAPSVGSFLGVNCTSALDCTAVGEDETDFGQPIYATETGGKWGVAMEVPAPPGVVFNGVSCTSATDCTAVGQAGSFAYFAKETAGVWGAPKELSMPGGSGWLTAVSCTSAQDCTAVGTGEHGGRLEPIYARETAGAWGPATEVFSPRGGDNFYGVSCTTHTDCTAVGDDGHFAIYPTERAGIWPRVPAPPRISKVTPGSKSVKVAWTAPTSDGGSRVTGYTASAVRGRLMFVCTSSQRSCTIDGLRNGRTYIVSVTARNTAGSSASSATKTVTPRP